ncbi:hypothetical protein MTO96_036861, partial [Rhipicephalus appendiculatus]
MLARLDMTCTRGYRAWLAVTVLAGLLAPMAAAQGFSTRDIKFTGAMPPMALDNKNVIGNYGLRGLVVWLYGVFAAILVPSKDPTQVFKENKAELDSKEYGGLLFSLVKRNVILIIVMLLSFVLCLAMPVAAVASIAFHRLCYCCKYWTTAEPSETTLQMRSRKKWTDAFVVFTALMSFNTFGALVTYTHFSRASSGIVEQTNFLGSALPTIVERLFKISKATFSWQELNVLADTNTNEFKTAMVSRADVCAGEVVSNIESTISKDPLLKFLSTTGQRLKTIQVELDAINSSMNGPKLSGVLAKTGRASAALREASTLSKGTMPQLKDTADQLDFSSQLAMPQPVKDLQDKMKQGDLQSELSKIPTPDNLDKEVKGLMG